MTRTGDMANTRESGWTRRRVIATAGAAMATFSPFGAVASRPPDAPLVLSFHNRHTGESLELPYRTATGYIPETLTAIDYLLRDLRTGEIHAIDPQLLDFVYALRERLDTTAPFDVISGYRSPATNAALARLGRGVARNSLHVYGMAIDFRVPGRRLRDVRRAALALKGGGVGYYPKSGFVHLDVGRVRRW